MSKPFDWERDSQPMTAAKPFDWEADSVPAPAPKAEEPGVWETLAHQGLAGFFKQGSDELAGQIGRLDPRYKIHGAAMDMPDGSVRFVENGDDAAAAETEAERQRLGREAEAHPIAALIGNVGGELASDATLKGLGVPGVGTLPYNLISGAASGALGSDADSTAGRVGGAVLGAGAALAGHGIGQYVAGPLIAGGGRLASKVLDSIPEAVREYAAKRALNAAGYIGKDIKPIARRNPELLVEKGQQLLDEGVVQPFQKAEAIAEQAAAKQDLYGDAIGKALKAADATGSKFNMKRFVDRARQEILAPLQGDPAVAGEAKQLADLLDDYANLPVGSIGFEKANQMKGNLQAKINWGNQWNDAKANIPNELRMKLQRIFLEEVDDQLGDAFSNAGQAGQRIRDAFKEVKRRYGIHADAADKARMGLARDEASDFKFSDKVVGGSVAGGGVVPAMIAGNPTLALGAAALGGVAALGNKLFRERGASTLAVGANKLADVLEMAAQSPATKWLVHVPADALEQYAGPLTSAASKGPQALATALYVLAQQDPKFRDMKKGAGN